MPYFENTKHLAVYDTLCATNLFATTLTFTQSATTITGTSALSAVVFYTDDANITNATINSLNNPAFNSIYTTFIANSASWDATYTAVQTNSANWQSSYFASNSANYILDGGNLKTQNLTIGTNDAYHLNFETYGTVKTTILSSGEVGIGTTSPGAKLNVVHNDTTNAVRITQTGSGNALVVEDETNPDSTPFVINNLGSVGIGTSSPNQPLTVIGVISATDTLKITQSNNDGSSGIISQSDNGSVTLYHNGAGQGRLRVGAVDVLTLENTNSVGIGTNTPLSQLHVSGSTRFVGTSGSSGIVFNSYPVLENINVVSGSANSTPDIDVTTNTTWLFTADSTATWVPNIRGNSTTTLNSIMSTNDAVNVTIISKQNNVSNRPTNFYIDGNAQTVLWEGGTAPTAGLSTAGYDIYSYIVTKTGNNTYIVFGSQSRLG